MVIHRLSDVVMSYKDFDDENLPTLSRALQLPSNETKLEITGMLKAKIQWMLSNVGEDSSNSRGSQKYGFYNHLLKGSFYDNNRDSQSSNSTSSVGNGNSSNRVSSSGTEDDRPGSTSSTKSQEPPRNNIISTEQLIIPVLCSHAYNEKIANGATI